MGKIPMKGTHGRTGMVSDLSLSDPGLNLRLHVAWVLFSVTVLIFTNQSCFLQIPREAGSFSSIGPLMKQENTYT